jgi:hypothetical protein
MRVTVLTVLFTCSFVLSVPLSAFIQGFINYAHAIYELLGHGRPRVPAVSMEGHSPVGCTVIDGDGRDVACRPLSPTVYERVTPQSETGTLAPFADNSQLSTDPSETKRIPSQLFR